MTPQEIKQSYSILGVCNMLGIELKKKSNKYWALCPFHGEKTPSFCVSEAKNMYKCFGCGVSGDLFNLVMETQGIDFIRAKELITGDYSYAYSYIPKEVKEEPTMPKILYRNDLYKFQMEKNDYKLNTFAYWFVNFFQKKFDKRFLFNHLQKWKVGTYQNQTIFTYIDFQNDIHNLKYFDFQIVASPISENDCKRNKERKPYYLKKADGYYTDCFFGEHLFDTEKDTYLVESEKTCIIGSLFYPNTNFLGINNAMTEKPKIDRLKAIYAQYNKPFQLIGDLDNGKENSSLYQFAMQLQGEGIEVELLDIWENWNIDPTAKNKTDLADFLVWNTENL